MQVIPPTKFPPVSTAADSSISLGPQCLPPDLHARWLSMEELLSMIDSWEFLAKNSVRQNPSFEPNYLIPALKHLSDNHVAVLVVEDVNAPLERRLVALLPIKPERIYRLPFKTAKVWKHEQCFDSTPLLARFHAKDAWSLICKKLDSSGFSLLSLDTVSAEGEINSVFQHTEKTHRVTRFQRDCFQRAAFVPANSSEEYAKSHLSKSIRKNTERLIRRLADLGTVTWESSNENSDFEQLAREFLRIESSGWKGNEGTALASNTKTKAFYSELIHLSAKAGKARFLSLNLDGKPIAMLSDIQSGNYVYSYKTAYDESFAKYSPGQQVEVKNLEFLHHDGIQFADSCTATDNATINRIWGQKQTFQNVVFSLKPGMGRIAIRMLPGIQSTVNGLRNLPRNRKNKS